MQRGGRPATGPRVATHLRRVRIETPNHTVRRAWDQAQLDMASLQLEDPTFAKGVFIPAAGVPWFVTLFGRDSLVVSMQGISGYPEFAAGALRRLSELQATEDDPERDMEPGKIPHEIRHGELAQLRILPFQPYYGTHDATSLFVIVISYLYQWLGDVARPGALPAQRRGGVRWIDGSGDRDGDGFQEYKTRSPHGYYNQGWKDAGDAIPHARRVARAIAARAVRAAGLRLRREAADGRHLRDRSAARAKSAAAAGRGRKRCTTGSTRRSGGRPRAPTTSGSTATSDRSRPSPPTPATAWRAASSRRTGRAGSSSG